MGASTSESGCPSSETSCSTVSKAISAGIGVPVVAEVEVAGMLAAEDGVFVAHERLDQRVADAGADRAVRPCSVMVSGTEREQIRL